MARKILRIKSTATNGLIVERKYAGFCPVCFRASKGFGFYKDHAKPEFFCSMQHLDMWKGFKKMDMTKLEDEMLLTMGKAGGKVLNELEMVIRTKSGTDITKDQWLSVLRSMVSKLSEIRPDYYLEKKQDLDDEIPF